MMQTELTKVMDVGEVTLTGLINRLEANGYVGRQMNDSMHRSSLINSMGASIVRSATLPKYV